MDLTGHKILALFLSWALMAAAFLLAIPLGGKFKKSSSGQLILDCINCFGGGVFLGVFLLKAIPEARSHLSHALLEPNHIVYPVSEVLIAAGFFLIMLVEILVYECVLKKKLVSPVVSAPSTDDRASPIYQVDLEQKDGADVSRTDLTVDTEAQHSNPISRLTKLSLVILIVALSIECIFEGIALGLMSSVGDVWVIFAAIMAHEIAISFCLGMEFVKYVTTLWVVIYGAFYSVTVSIGIAIGLGIYESGDHIDTDLAKGILLSLAAGVFLFCTFLGILNKQLMPGTAIAKYVFVFAGFVFMAGIAGIEHHDHDHDHDH